MKSEKKFNIASLFSGCGGLDLGFELAGHFNIAFANDIYYPSCKTFSKNFSLKIVEGSNISDGSILCDDVEKIGFSKTPKKVDVVTGGPPCQDFSLIRGPGKRKGISVKRGRLYVHFIRALVTLQPKVFVFENVKGLVSANEGLAFTQIVEDFKNLNLRWHDMWKNHKDIVSTVKKNKGLKNYEILFSSVVDFSKLGVPQQRERIIIIGARKDLTNKISLPDFKEKIGSELMGSNDLLTSFPLTPIEVFTGKPLTELENYYKKIMLGFNESSRNIHSIRSDQYFSTVWNRYNFEIWHDYLVTNNLPPTINEKIKKSVIKRHVELLKELGYYNKPLDKLVFEDGSNQILTEKEYVKLRMSFIPPGENHEFVRGTEHEVVGLMSNIYKKVHPLKPSPTVIAMGGGGTWGYHYLKERQRLTNRERARLQTFPDSFLFFGKPSEVRRQIGEAVPPLASKRLAEVVLYILRKIGL
jgi:DNA (cytosine-5)-methyltransferase 1